MSMFGRRIRELKENIAASLYMQPATLAGLMERDFLAHYSDYLVDRLLMQLEGQGWIYQDSKDRYHTYKRVAKRELREYELGI